MKSYIPKQLKEIENTRFVILDGKRPIHQCWTLNPQFYERQEDGSWKHKESGEFYKVRNKETNEEEIYYGAPGNYPADSEELEKAMNSGWNGGFLTGSGEVEDLDADNKELFEWALANLPATFVIKTGSEEDHYHFYFKRKGENPKIILERQGVHYGEWMAAGQQVVLCGSEHPKTKKEYVIFKDLPIAEITEEHIELLKENFTDGRDND